MTTHTPPSSPVLVRALGIGLTVLALVGLGGYATYHTLKAEDDKATIAAAAETQAAACVPDPDRPNRTTYPLGAMVPDFRLKRLTGEWITLQTELKRQAPRYMLLEFFSSWCPHCQASAPVLETLYEANREHLDIMSINVGDGPDKPSTSQAFKDTYHITYPILERPPATCLIPIVLAGFRCFICWIRPAPWSGGMSAPFEIRIARRSRR